MPIASTTLTTIQEVLEHYGLEPDAVRDIRTGRVNKHWRVEADSRDLVLRRYTPHRSDAAIAFEHAVLEHASSRDWPVAQPITVRGETTVESGGHRYALFPLLPGRNPRFGGIRRMRTRGRLLGRLHRDLTSWKASGQRDGFGRLPNLDFVTRRHGTFEKTLVRLAQEQPQLATQIDEQRQRSMIELDQSGYDELPLAPIHGDFHRDHLLFERRTLTGLLDFDLSRLDARVADIGISIASDCRVPTSITEIDLSCAAAFVRGYTEENPLPDAEVRLFVPLARAFLLWLVAFFLARWADGDAGRWIEGIRRTVHLRLAGLDDQERELAGALDEAAYVSRGAPGR